MSFFHYVSRDIYREYIHHMIASLYDLKWSMLYLNVLKGGSRMMSITGGNFCFFPFRERKGLGRTASKYFT